MRSTKSQRVLYLYVLLDSGKPIKMNEMIQLFDCDGRTIQRDLADIRAFLSELASAGIGYRRVVYDASQKVYRLADL